MSHIAGLSLYAQNAILTAIGGAAFSTGTLYLGLDTTEAGSDDTGGVEVSNSGTGYVRQAIPLAAYSNGSRTTNADILFPVATASYGTVVAFRIWDSGSYGAGNCIARGTLTSKLIDVSDRFETLAGNLTITFSRTVT